MFGLVFCDGRRDVPQVEFAIEADLNLVLLDVAVAKVAKIRENFRERGAAEEHIIEAPPIRVAVFGAHRPIVGDGILDAAADRPAHLAFREVARAKKGREVSLADRCAKPVVIVLGVELAKGNTTGGVDEEAVPGETDAATDRALNWGACLCCQAGAVREGQTGGVAQAGSVNRAFNTNHPLIEL